MQTVFLMIWVLVTCFVGYYLGKYLGGILVRWNLPSGAIFLICALLAITGGFL